LNRKGDFREEIVSEAISPHNFQSERCFHFRSRKDLGRGNLRLPWSSRGS